MKSQRNLLLEKGVKKNTNKRVHVLRNNKAVLMLSGLEPNTSHLATRKTVS